MERQLLRKKMGKTIYHEFEIDRLRLTSWEEKDAGWLSTKCYGKGWDLRGRLVRYQHNPSSDQPAMAVSAFGSANVGTVSIPSTVFATGNDDDVLAKGFKTHFATIQKIKAADTF
ncbi:Uncharacterized protein TCM_031043 [Theobroma cacao]|uniref:Uncharacterized protein n=1 Tax=Theobroma cacao TaxID=3641 RepID=A0A061F6L0_THECC|nr:Uncharacterized protein TCM_031043 [Theobroma cacao]